MSALVLLIPVALLLGAAGLAAFLWSARNGQFEDMDGAGQRIFLDPGDRPVSDREAPQSREQV